MENVLVITKDIMEGRQVGMEGGYERYSVSVLLVVRFLLEDLGSGERTNFVNGLLGCPGTVSPGHETFLQVPGMGGKVCILGADPAKSEGLAVGDAGLAVTGVAAG